MGPLRPPASHVGMLSGTDRHPGGFQSHRATTSLWRIWWRSFWEPTEIHCLFSGIILTGGQYDEITTELFIPQPCPGGIQHCLLPDFAKVQRYRHTQDGFMACGGSGHQRDCITLDPGTGIWQTSYTWEDPGRYGHVSWVSPYGQTPVIMGVLMGGFGPFTTTGLTTTLLTMASGVPGFGFGFGLFEPSV